MNDLPLLQRQILLILADGGAMRVGQICRLMASNACRVGGHLGSLSGLGLIARNPDAGYLWQLTAMGTSTANELQGLVHG